MTSPFTLRTVLALGAAAALALPLGEPGAQTLEDPGALELPGQAPVRVPDVIYVPTPDSVVKAMIRMAGVRRGDVVYDLGCGDGRLVVAAARAGARKAVGVDIDPERVAEAEANVKAAGLQGVARIVEGDLFEMDLGDADVVTLYLLPELNLRLRPTLLGLKPGARIVSHAFDMGDWKPDRVERVDGRWVYLWTVPARGRVQARSAR
jgi:SAM-dependent methyltransferase